MKFNLTILIQAAGGGLMSREHDSGLNDGIDGGHLRKQGINLEIDN